MFYTHISQLGDMGVKLNYLPHHYAIICLFGLFVVP